MKKLKEFLVLLSLILIFFGLFIFLTYGFVYSVDINNQPQFFSSIHLLRLLFHDKIFISAIINTITRPLITSVIFISVFSIILKNAFKVKRKIFYLTAFISSFIITVIYLRLSEVLFNVFGTICFSICVSLLCLFTLWNIEFIIYIFRKIIGKKQQNQQWVLVQDSNEKNKIWNEFYEKFEFKPDCNDKTTCPFNFSKFGNEVKEYNLGNTIKNLIPFDSNGKYRSTPQIEMIKSMFAQCMGDDVFMYALDWQHSIFKYNPRINEPYQPYMMYKTNEDSRVYFPSFHPNGDYCFFASKNFDWGYFTHPWQEKVWVFGKKMVELVNENYQNIGFVKK